MYRSTDGAQSWMQIIPPADKGFFSIGGMSWLSAQAGYLLICSQPSAGTQPKTLYYTKDGDSSWSIRVTTGNPPDFNKEAKISLGGYGLGIKFFSNGTGYLSLMRGTIEKSVDYGASFNSISEYDDRNQVPDFINSMKGYAVFYGSDIYNTDDGGKHWSKVISVNSDFHEER